MIRFDPFREVDRLADQLLSGWHTPRPMPMDVFRVGDHYVVNLDLPGVDPGSVDLNVEDNVLTVRAQRSTRREGEDVQIVVAERPAGEFTRQLAVGEGLDLEKISATLDHGVLTVTVPVAERARPRRIEVTSSGGGAQQLGGSEQRQVIEGSTSG